MNFLSVSPVIRRAGRDILHAWGKFVLAGVGLGLLIGVTLSMAVIVYTLTLGKIREIAVLKLIGTRNRTIAAMILQQSVGLGVIGFVVGEIAATCGRRSSPNMCYSCPATRRGGS